MRLVSKTDYKIIILKRTHNKVLFILLSFRFHSIMLVYNRILKDHDIVIN